MDHVPRKRYGKDALRQRKVRELASLAESGVSQQAIRNKTSKTDEEFLDAIVETLHGVAIGIDSRNISGIADLEKFVEARSLAFRIHRKFVTAKGASAK